MGWPLNCPKHSSVWVNLLSSMGITVFLSARTKPRGEPNRKKSDTSKSNFPRELPSSMVLLLDLREAASLRKMLECKLQGECQVITDGRCETHKNKDGPVFTSRCGRRTLRGRPGVAWSCPVRRWRSRFFYAAFAFWCLRLHRHEGCRCYCGWDGGCPPGLARLTRGRCWQ